MSISNILDQAIHELSEEGYVITKPKTGGDVDVEDLLFTVSELYVCIKKYTSGMTDWYEDSKANYAILLVEETAKPIFSWHYLSDVTDVAVREHIKKHFRNCQVPPYTFETSYFDIIKIRDNWSTHKDLYLDVLKAVMKYYDKDMLSIT